MLGRFALRKAARSATAVAEAICALTFELRGRRRQDARARLAKMYRVPPAGPWWPAVGAPLERGVRPHCSPTPLACERDQYGAARG